MPKKTGHKGITSGPRKSLKGRAQGQQAIGAPQRPASAPAAVIADSFYSLKLPPRTGAHVFLAKEGSNVKMDQVERLTGNLWETFMQLHFLVKGERTKFNPLKAGLSVSTSLSMAINGISGLLPKSFGFNVDDKDETFSLTIYSSCDNWGAFWHILKVGHVLQVLAAKNKRLHNLFLSFLRQFSERIGISLWDEGMMGDSMESLDERLLNMPEEDYSPTDIESVKDDIRFYQEGPGREYARKIRYAKPMTPRNILKVARRFKGPIAGIICQGCLLLDKASKIWEFIYDAEEYEDSYYLSLNDQVNIVWRDNDNLFYEHEGTLEALSNEGVQSPFVSQKIAGNVKKFSFDGLIERKEWLQDLSKFFISSYQVIQKFEKDEPINGHAAKKSPRPSAHCSVRC
jgi:hypothetical protein